jgi:hypothetical protein
MSREALRRRMDEALDLAAAIAAELNPATPTPQLREALDLLAEALDEYEAAAVAYGSA